MYMTCVLILQPFVYLLAVLPQLYQSTITGHNAQHQWPAPSALCKKQWENMEISVSTVLTPEYDLEVMFWLSHTGIFGCPLVRGASKGSSASVASVYSNVPTSLLLMRTSWVVHWRSVDAVCSWTLECSCFPSAQLHWVASVDSVHIGALV